MSEFSPQILLQFIKQLEALAQEKEQVTDQINDILKEAEGSGIQKAILKKILMLRKRDPEKIQQEEDILQVYLDAIAKAERIYDKNQAVEEKAVLPTIGFQEKKEADPFVMNTF